MSTAITGKHRATLTEQLLQTTGMPPEWASFTNDVLTIGGTMGGTAIIRASRLRAFPNFHLSTNDQSLFGQKSVSANFSEMGAFKSISEVVRGLKQGTISPEALPIKVVVRNGRKITLNNRSLLALRRAGIKPKVIIDKTGIEKYELLLNDHLRGNLPGDGIRVRGGPPSASLIGPLE